MGETLSNVPKTTDVPVIEYKNSTTTVAEETVQTVEHRFVIPDIITKTKEVTVVGECTTDDHLPQQAVGSNEMMRAVSVTEAKETKILKRSSSFFEPTWTEPYILFTSGLTHEDSIFLSDEDTEYDNDTLGEDKQRSLNSNSRPVKPMLNHSFTNSVQSFESFESVPGPEDKMKR